MEIDEESIKLPIDIAIDDEITSLIHKYELKAHIIEIIPFRGKYQQITESTPIDLFKQEML